jgi:hypothetical protein
MRRIKEETKKYVTSHILGVKNMKTRRTTKGSKEENIRR